MMEFVLVTLAVLLVFTVIVARVVWWCWLEAEEAARRERMRQRANGGDADIVNWGPMLRREREQ